METAPQGGARFSLEECYGALQRSGDERVAAEQLLNRRQWIHDVGDFDERTGYLLPSPLSAVCARLRSLAPPRPPGKDRLYRIVEHTREPLMEIMRRLRERLVREHASLPIRAVRELDSASFFALSRRPGRTVREKLADRPYLWAVRRRWTVDTTENRLVKAYCLRLAYLLRVREDCRGTQDEPQVTAFLVAIDSWLQSGEAKEIGRWENLPPNNLLLGHRDYRRIWDAWRWIGSLDDDMGHDNRQRLAQWMTILFWSIVSRLGSDGGVRFIEQPCYLDYEGLSIASARMGDSSIASLEGVIGAPPPGQCFGPITRLGIDRHDKGYGLVTLGTGKTVFFHSRMFAERSVYEGLSKGTLLAFDVEESEDGKLVAVAPFVPPRPAGFRVGMDRSGRIVLRPPQRGDLEVQCGLVDGGVQIRVGSRAVTAALSRETARNIADGIASAVFGVRGPPAPLVRSTVLPQAAECDSTLALDLCSLRPRFAQGMRRGVLPFRLLWQRWHRDGAEPVAIDLGSAKAVAIDPEVSSVSILDLLSAEQTAPAADLSQAARHFASKLKDSHRTERLTYLVPDSTDEFALSTLRRSLNAAFRIAAPLPRSIAAVFDWQSRDAFAAAHIADGDCLLVLDTVGETLSATPLIARTNVDLASRVSETAGVYWERCPCVRVGPESTSRETATRVLRALDCGFPEEVARLCGLQGLIDEGCQLSWQNEQGDWYNPPPAQGRALKRVLGDLRDPWRPENPISLLPGSVR